MKKVLLTSESMVFLNRNTNLLMKREFGLMTATSGAEALRLHKEHHFDLILTDFELDDMGGCTLCSLIRKEDNTPVILICHNIQGSIERVRKSSASAMLLKPIDPIQLLETVGSFIGFQIGRSKRVVLKVKVFSKNDDLEFFCFSHDISNTGILIETEYELTLGSRITCQFTLPDLCLIETEGEVIRYLSASGCENLFGVKFTVLPLSYCKAIDSYIASIPNSRNNSQIGSHTFNKIKNVN